MKPQTEYTECRLSVLSTELGPSPPRPQASVAPPFGSKGGDTLDYGGGGGGPSSDEGTDTLVLYVYGTIIPLQVRPTLPLLSSCLGLTHFTYHSTILTYLLIFFLYFSTKKMEKNHTLCLYVCMYRQSVYEQTMIACTESTPVSRKHTYQEIPT